MSEPTVEGTSVEGQEGGSPRVALPPARLYNSACLWTTSWLLAGLSSPRPLHRPEPRHARQCRRALYLSDPGGHLREVRAGRWAARADQLLVLLESLRP